MDSTRTTTAYRRRQLANDDGVVVMVVMVVPIGRWRGAAGEHRGNGNAQNEGRGYNAGQHFVQHENGLLMHLTA